MKRISTIEVYHDRKNPGSGMVRMVDGTGTIKEHMSDNVKVVDDRKNRLWWLDLLMVWFVMFGLYPLLDTGHDLSGMWAKLDVLFHVTGVVWHGFRWRLIRRF